MPIESKMLTKFIEGAQQKVEGNNFATRRNVLNFDDVMNKQREVIYGQRNQVLDGVDLHATIQKMIDEYFTAQVQFYCPSSLPKAEWNVKGMQTKFGWILDGEALDDNASQQDYIDLLLEKAHARYSERSEKYGDFIMQELERKILLQNVASRWMEHIDAMEALKRGI